jgi:hypothetical protein
VQIGIRGYQQAFFIGTGESETENLLQRLGKKWELTGKNSGLKE